MLAWVSFLTFHSDSPTWANETNPNNSVKRWHSNEYMSRIFQGPQHGSGQRKLLFEAVEAVYFSFLGVSFFFFDTSCPPAPGTLSTRQSFKEHYDTPFGGNRAGRLAF